MSNLTTFSGNGNNDLRMSSREIAELTGKEHFHVKRDIENMLAELEIDVSKFGCIYRDSRNREKIEYLLPKDLTVTLITGYRANLRYKVVKRLEEYEDGPQAPQLDTNFAREVRLQTKMFASMAKTIGLEGNQLALSVNNGVRSIMGVDILTGMGLERLPAPVNEPDLTPTDIGNRLGGMPARQINSALCQYEYQIRHRDLKGRIYYELTDKGKNAGGIYKDTGKKHSDGTPVKQLMWAASIVDHFEAEMGVMA